MTSLSFATSINAQTHVYEAFIRGNKVGEMKVVQEVNDESEKISVVTHIEAHMLVSIRVDFESHSSYMDGKLIEATAISKTNGRVHSQAQTSFKNGSYTVKVDRKTKTLAQKTIYGGDLFYCEEPTDMKEVYSLASGELLQVEKAGDHEYYFVHDGKKELHKYTDGVLSELQIDHRLYTVIFKLKE
ncbi:MAG: hypothetical protein Roseis2KO_44980 [Roseivirga sp.]